MNTRPRTVHTPEAASRPGRLARFRARFDDGLLLAPQASGSAPALPPNCVDESALRQALTALCAGPAGFASAHHWLANDAAQQQQQKAWLDHQLLALDGTWHMLSLGGPWRQRLHRLALKARETLAAAEQRAPTWDCGYLKPGDDAGARAAAFEPRRPTLMVAWQWPAAQQPALQAALQAFEARGRSYALPVRLWLLGTPAPT